MRGASRAHDFRLARIGAAAALTGVLIVILVIDALGAEYQVDPLVVTALLGTLGTLLGIEGLAALRQTQPPVPEDRAESAFDHDTQDPEEE